MEVNEVHGITQEKLTELCKKAFDYLNKNKNMGLVFKDCFIAMFGIRGNIHISYYRENGQVDESTRSIGILDTNETLGVDKEGNLSAVSNPDSKIILRIAYNI